MRSLLFTVFLTVVLALSFPPDANAQQSIDDIIQELAEARSQLTLAQERLKQAQESDAGDDVLAQLEREQAIASAQAAIMEAQLKEYLAQQKYAEATKEEEAVSEEEKARQEAVEAANAAKALADAEKAAAEATKAASEAESAAITAKSKAIFGDVPKSTIEGTVTAGAKAGEAEATLLAAKAMRDLAQRIAPDIKSAAGSDNIWLVSDDSVPDMTHKFTFMQQSRFVISTQEKAISANQSLEGDLGYPGFLEAIPVAAIAAGVEAFANLGSFFKSDYSAAGVEVPNFGDDPLVDALAGALTKLDASVFTPKTYHPALPAFDEDTNDILRRLTQIADNKASLSNFKAVWEDRKATLEADIKTKEAEIKKAKADGADEETITNLTQELKALQGNKDKITGLISQITAAIAATDSFITIWTTIGEAGENLIKNLIMAEYMSQQLKNGDRMLVVNLTATKGGHYTKKNLWTFFGSMPFYHMGGAVLNYRLLDGKTGKVLAADTAMLHGGFYKSHKVKAALEGRE